MYFHLFTHPCRDGPYYVIGYGRRRAAGGRPHRFPHDHFSSVYWIFTKLDHKISLCKGKNHIYFGVIISKVKVTVTINIIVDNRIVSHDNFSSVYWIFTKLCHLIPL
jgi:hypothetical protein